MKTWEDYLIEGTNTLKNKLNINNQDELHNIETNIIIERLGVLISYGISGEYDSNHLKAIHWYLFSPIYDFAGEYREVDLYKNQTKFLEYDKISVELDKLLLEAKNKDINQDNLFDIAKFLGNFYYKLILIHPFREGNGRSIREYLREFTSFKFPNYTLNYNKINKKNFLLGITEHDTYPLLLAYEIYNALDKNKTRKIIK